MNTIQPLYSLTNIRRSFGERVVLDIPHLALAKGKIYGLLGPNGAGKTTLMRLLSFMDATTQGEIAFAGVTVTPDMFARYRARVVWVPQTPVLFSGSLLYNVEYPMLLKGAPRHVRRAKAMELLESVRLDHLAASPARRLSGGEAQRASIARALAAGAEVILFDEPTANVDYRSRAEIIALIRSLWKDRALSILVTTHDKPLADELTHEQLSLFAGKIVGKDEADVPAGRTIGGETIAADVFVGGMAAKGVTAGSATAPEEITGSAAAAAITTAAYAAHLHQGKNGLCVSLYGNPLSTKKQATTAALAEIGWSEVVTARGPCNLPGEEVTVAALALAGQGSVTIRLARADGRVLVVCIYEPDSLRFVAQLHLGKKLYLCGD